MTRTTTDFFPEAHHEMVEIGGCDMAYWRIGDGPDLVFVHGWPLHSATWRDIVRGLDGYTCHLLDLPGTGGTTSRDRPESFATQSEAVERVVEHIGLERYGLVGHDSGGLIAREVAARHPDSVSALVISGSEIPGHMPWQIRMFRLATKLPGDGAGLRFVLGNRLLRNSQLALGGCFADMSVADGEFGELFVKPLVDDREVFAGQFGLLQTFDPGHVDSLADVHPKISCPTLMIWGERDPFFPPGKAQAMAEQFGGPVRFETIEDARLFVHEEHPARFADLCDRFLTETVPT